MRTTCDHLSDLQLLSTSLLLQGNWESSLLTLLQIRLSSFSNFRLKSQIFWGKCECISWSSPENQEKKGGLPWWLSGIEFTCQCRRCRFDPWVKNIPWRRKWQPTPVFLPGKSHGHRSLADYSPWGCKRVGCDLTTKQQQHTRAHVIVKAAQVQSQPGWLVGWRPREELMQIESKDSLLAEFLLPCER